MTARSRRAVAVGLLVGLGGALLVAVVVLARRDTGVEPGPEMAAVLATAVAASPPFDGLTATELSVGGDCLEVVIADDLDERVQGLRGVEDLGPYDGMLFVFDDERVHRFTMSDTLVPLDIGFYDRDGSRVAGLMMVPCPLDEDDCPLHAATVPSLFALETLAGELPAGGVGGCG